MPHYEYQCAERNHKFEVYRKATDPPLTRCPRCRGQVRKIFHPVGIIFKGSGFHVTDYPSRDRESPGKETAKRARPEKEKPAGAASSKESEE